MQEELGMPYQIKKHQRGADQFAPPELATVYPIGTAPVIQDEDVTVGESGAIVGEIRLSPFVP